MSADTAIDNSVNLPTSTSTSTPIIKGRSKAKGKATVAPGGKRGINLSMPQEDYERFYIHALRLTGGNISELVCKLGREHLRDFHITRTGRSGDAA